MHEFLPVCLGICLAFVCEAMPSHRKRLFAWVSGSVIAGGAATFLTGEWQVSWAFLLIDVPLVALSAALSRLLLLRGAQHSEGAWLAPYRRGPGRPATH